MAPESFGMPGPDYQRAGLAAATIASGNGIDVQAPPPSTLAAQLVENISAASVRSSSSLRPDETQELQRLFNVIEHVKNQPEVLRTHADRVEHNHMLIYVFGRVALDGFRLAEDPFANRAQLTGEILKAINFLKVTIKETPSVLGFVADEKTFLFRRGEPLWLWILPKFLKLLGLAQCVNISSSIEGVIQFILVTTNQHSALWSITPAITRYIQDSVDAILQHLEVLATADVDQSLSLRLPRKRFRSDLPNDAASSKACTYLVGSVRHAIRHAWSLLKIFASVITSDKLAQELPSAFQQMAPWVVDSLPAFYNLQERWEEGLENLSIPTIDCLLKLAAAYGDAARIEIEIQHKVLGVLAMLCGRVVERPSELLRHDEAGVAARRIFCLAMIQLSHTSMNYRPVGRLVASQLIGQLAELVSMRDIVGTGTDFTRCYELLRNASSDAEPGAFRNEVQLAHFIDTDLRRSIVALNLHSPQVEASEPVLKRRKLSAEPPLLYPLVERLCGIFKADALMDYELLESLVVNGFSSLSDHACCQVLTLLGYIPCAADNTLALAISCDSPRSESDSLRCSFCCSASDKGRSHPACLDIAARSASIAIFSRLIRLPSFLNSRRPRVIAMMSLKRLVAHCRSSEFLDLEKSVAGHWCLQSLNSSVRELRIASGRILASFLVEAERLSPELGRRNRANALGFLKSLSDKNVAHLNETCIMAWGQVGITVPDEDEPLSLVLVKLLDFLGHTNTIISAFAFNEILNLARARRTTPRRLFEPFWRSIAFSTVKDMVARPQTTRLTAELLQISVPDHLRLVQQYALPWLVLSRKKEVIQKIAEARGEEAAWQPCLDRANLGSILALLLVQDVTDVEEYVLTTLRMISSHFEGKTFEALLGSETVETVLELLKEAGDATEDKKERIRTALGTLANVLLDNNRKSSARKKSLVSRFLQQHALGLTSSLAEVISDSSPRHYPVHEQRRSIRAMEEMIKLCKFDIRIARPQISAFLISALSFDELRADAFSCWSVMLTHLEYEDVEALLETTFFIIGHYWQIFEDTTRATCHHLLDLLLTKNKAILQTKINALPSFRNIPDLAEPERRLNALRQSLDDRATVIIFAGRLGNENPGVVLQALTELSAYLRSNQAYLQTSAVSEQPDTAVATLLRALLDCSSKYNGTQPEIVSLCVQCMGHVGCLDSNRLETERERREFIVLKNFESSDETTDFVIFTLEEVLVKAFLSTTDTNFQGFLSYAMQELLDRAGLKTAYANQGRDGEDILLKWTNLPESAREVLIPFMTSRYRAKEMTLPAADYPIFRPSKLYGNWLRTFVLDLLQKGQNAYASILFEPLCRVIRVKDLVVAEFLLPYLVLHIVLGDENVKADRERVLNELRSILLVELPDNASYAERANLKLYFEAVFRVLDYATRWVQMKKAQNANLARGERRDDWVRRVERMINVIPADLIARRAIDCNQYARALFHLEPHATKIRSDPKADRKETDRMLSELQYIYAQIDEPDGLEGISASLSVVDLNQQILSHRKAGRWAQAQTWSEIRLAEDPNNVDVQLELLTCLKESGQYDVLLNYVEGINTTPTTINRIAPFAVEASWATGRWDTLQKYLNSYNGGHIAEVFNLGIGHALLCLREGRSEQFTGFLQLLREKVGASMSYAATSSLQACHDAMLKAHVLADLELIAERQGSDENPNQQETLTTLNRRLEVIGAYVTDKQYLLGIRRAAMELMRPKFGDGDISSLWLSSARLARKAGSMNQSFNAVLHAHRLGDGAATIDNARLLWKEGNHRKAIQVLESAIANNSFIDHSNSLGSGLGGLGSVAPTSSRTVESHRKLVTARAHLLLAKWLDLAGQTHASALRQQFQLAAKTHSQWEKGHYYLGRHYKKVLESEKELKPEDQSDEFLSGETAKLVVENYIRSLGFGTKYLYQTLPRILTLWLELGAAAVNKDKSPEEKLSPSKELLQRRKAQLEELQKTLLKHVQRLPAYIFYTALPQMVARITHPNPVVFQLLKEIIIKVVEAHPRQSLWSMFGIMTFKNSGSKSSTGGGGVADSRQTRGVQILQALNTKSSKKSTNNGGGGGSSSLDLRQLMRAGEKLAEQLLLACNNGDFQSNRSTMASLTRDLHFNPKCTPCPLVVPIESCLAATLPALTDSVRKHKAFSQDVITIRGFLDEVLVLSSLAKPRKLTAKGSDGRTYGLMVKPKDDLRTDQRLMEFNGMINRSLKRDAESSRRQLYIRTYAVTPLNEECGIIEWVEGLKTLRDILLNIYKSRGIAPNYGQIQQLMRDSVSAPHNAHLFTETVLGIFPAVLPVWFTSQFPNPSAWFVARLKYTRSCAVMSMVGTILGLGDRHGENVLLEEGNGGVFHVDFNCLFDKGLTFATPERVPFRLTHNMRAAMGIHGHEGAFRRCSELTLKILRQQEETLMTILEAFIYDPTLDLQREKKRGAGGGAGGAGAGAGAVAGGTTTTGNGRGGGGGGVRLNPHAVVESIRRKVRGLLPDESIPLGVEGQVEELIKQAIDPRNLASMYIGWCPFL